MRKFRIPHTLPIHNFLENFFRHAGVAMKHLKRSDVMKRPPPQTKGEERDPSSNKGGGEAPSSDKGGGKGPPRKRGEGPIYKYSGLRLTMYVFFYNMFITCVFFLCDSRGGKPPFSGPTTKQNIFCVSSQRGEFHHSKMYVCMDPFGALVRTET